MVGETKIYQGQQVQVMGVVNGDEVVVQFADGSRQPVYRRDLTDPPKPESNRPVITKGIDIGPGTGGADLKEPDDAPPAAPTEAPVPTVVPEQPAAPVEPALDTELPPPADPLF